MASWTTPDADYPIPGYDAWRTCAPAWALDERSECDQLGCDEDGHAIGCPDRQEEEDE